MGAKPFHRKVDQTPTENLSFYLVFDTMHLLDRWKKSIKLPHEHTHQHRDSTIACKESFVRKSAKNTCKEDLHMPAVGNWLKMTTYPLIDEFYIQSKFRYRLFLP